MKVAPVTAGSVLSQGNPQWLQLVNKLQRSQEELKAKIRNFDVDHPAHDWLQETADRVQDVS